MLKDNGLDKLKLLENNVGIVMVVERNASYVFQHVLLSKESASLDCDFSNLVRVTNQNEYVVNVDIEDVQWRTNTLWEAAQHVIKEHLKLWYD